MWRVKTCYECDIQMGRGNIFPLFSETACFLMKSLASTGCRHSRLVSLKGRPIISPTLKDKRVICIVGGDYIMSLVLGKSVCQTKIMCHEA